MIPDTIKSIKRSDYQEILLSLGNSIHVLAETEEKLSGTSDLNSRKIELSGLLKELNCPYECLMSGNISDRFENEKDSLLLLDYLVTELMSLQMYHSQKSKDPSADVIQLVNTIVQCMREKGDTIYFFLFSKRLPLPPHSSAYVAPWEWVPHQLIWSLTIYLNV